MSDINNSIDNPTVLADHSTSEWDSVAQRDRIARRAYALYEERGRMEGFDLRDWLEAEREVLAQESIH